jgi:hypothetical protein
MALADALITYKIIKILTTPFTQTDAYRLGVIDAHGKQIKQPTTPAEQASYNVLNRLVFRLKIVLNLIPIENKQFLSYAAALLLVRECYYDDEIPENLDELFLESINNRVAEEIETLSFKSLYEEGEGMAPAPSATVPANTQANIKDTITGVGKKAKIRYFRRSKLQNIGNI